MDSTTHQEPLIISPVMIHSTSHTPLASHAPQPSEDSDKTDTDTCIALARSSSPTPTVVSHRSAIWNHLMDDVKPALLAEFGLVLLTFSTGIQDAASFPDYRCFTSSQTGNTIFLMLALIMPDLDGRIFITSNLGASLGFFLAGTWFTGQLSHIVGPRRRIWLVSCNFLQSCMVFAAASIQYRYGIDLQGDLTIAVIGLLAFSAGSQIVQSRSFKMIEISTAMATAAWVDAMVDPRMFKLTKNRPQARRVAFLVSLIIGALVGAAIYRTSGSAVSLYVSAAGKLVVALIFLLKTSDEKKAEESKV